MPRRGPSKTPTAVLKARGSWRAKEDRDNEPEGETLTRVPMCPDYFEVMPIAKKCWNDSAKQLVDMGVLATSDLRCLERYCVTYADWRECIDPDLKLKLGAAWRSDERKLGLSPGDRASMKTDKPKKDSDDKAAKYFGGLKVAK